MCNCFPTNFYHGIHDVMAPLLNFPERVLRGSYFVVPRLGWVVVQISEILGLHPVVMAKGEFLWADELVFIEPDSCHHENPVALRRLRAWLAKWLRLDRSEPELFVFLNRPLGGARHIENMRETAELFAARWPEWPWALGEFPAGIVESALYFNNVRWFLAPHGAGHLNLMFQQGRGVRGAAADGDLAVLREPVAVLLPEADSGAAA
jgi:hypothetical protein